MRKKGKPQSPAQYLEELRSIAQAGLNDAKDPHDRERYGRLLELAAGEYARLSGLAPKEIDERFRAEIGEITAKVAVDGAIFSPDGSILLARRADDRRWGMPGGWVEPGETLQDSLRRHVREETGLEVEPGKVIHVASRLPGDFGRPHTSCHITFFCETTGGDLRSALETLEVGFFDFRRVVEWHGDHQERVEFALDFWHKNVGAEE